MRVPSLVAASAALALIAALTASSTADGPGQVHSVVRGDTLTDIASSYGVTVHALVAANHLRSERVPLRIGQRLIVPPPESATRRIPRLPPGAAHKLGEVVGPASLVLAIPGFVDEAPRFTWPSYGPITSPFGRRRRGWHRGVDILGQRGDLIRAAAPGLVVASTIEPRYGNVIKIEHSDGFMTVYGHNNENLVDVGKEVQTGDVIGRIGRTGQATAEHVHFEIRRNGRFYNPLYFLPMPPQIARVDDRDADDSDE